MRAFIRNVFVPVRATWTSNRYVTCFWSAGPDQRSSGAIDITVRRNGYGRQLASFEADLAVDGLDSPFHAVFIRAPVVERVGAEVEILARHDGAPVLVRQRSCTVTSFHPELTPDGRLHAMFVESI